MSDIQPSDIPQGQSDEDILARARARFTLCEEAETEIRKEAKDDIKFCAGDQWPEDVKTARVLDKRPCLTINRLTEPVRQVLNEMRQNRQDIKVDPLDDQGDVETAEVLQGMIRHIEVESGAEIAYDTACSAQVKSGFGYYRLLTDYCDPDSFDQEIFIKRIRDQFSVYLDPNATEPDGSDTEYGFIVDSMSKETYQRQFPGTKLSGLDWSSIGSSSSWVNKDEVRIAEYYEKVYKKTKLFQLDDGRVVRADELNEELLATLRKHDAMSLPQIVQERETHMCEVKWYKINGLDILDRTDVHGTYIPIIPVYGDEYFVDGKRILESLVRQAKDPQRMYNYWKTAATEMIALAPKAPYVGYEGQFEGFEDKWKTANVKTYPYLETKIVQLPGGQVAPLPQRQQYEVPVQGINQQAMTCIEDVKSTTGIYTATVGGDRAPELSGVALKGRVTQSNLTNFHFPDNFRRALRHTGCILLEWIPKVYTKAQAIRILKPDGQQKIVKINEVFDQAGMKKAYYVGKGKYGVTVDSGPNFQTRRQEAVAGMLDLTKILPQQMGPTADLIVRQMDFPGAQEVADRLKKMLPPALQDGDDKQPPIPPQVAAQLSQAHDILQKQSQLIAQQDEVIRTKKVEMESKERVEAMKFRNDIIIEYMKHDLGGARDVMNAEIQAIDKRLELLHEQARIINQPGDGPSPAASPGQVQPPTGG